MTNLPNHNTDFRENTIQEIEITTQKYFFARSHGSLCVSVLKFVVHLVPN